MDTALQWVKTIVLAGEGYTTEPVVSGTNAMLNTLVDPTREHLLDTAERLFYANGIQAVGMDELRQASGVPLKRIYQLYSGKADIIVAFLRRRDVRWRGGLSAYVDQVEGPRERVLAVFDWLHQWFSEPDFRGCAWINAYGELGGTSPAVVDEVRRHKDAFRRYVTRLTLDAGCSRPTATAIHLLAEGAMVTAGIQASPKAAKDAKKAVQELLDADHDRPATPQRTRRARVTR
jgi:AcrR family transcriptional regulator